MNPALREGLVGAGIGAAVGLASGALLSFANWFTVAPHGSTAPIFFALLVFAPVLLLSTCGSVWAVFLSVLAIPIRSLRARLSPSLILGVLACYAALFATMRCGGDLRREGFADLARRSRPLVAAIRKYEVDRGAPPPSLEALVPTYLAEVPGTGMGAYPKYEYWVRPDTKTMTAPHGDSDFVDSVPCPPGKIATPELYYDNPWVLHFFCSSGGINFDRFLYFPLQNYPARGYGGWLERIEDWAYVHE